MDEDMNYPKQLQVLIEGDDNTVTAIRLHVSARYNAAEYEDTNGRRFYIDQEYIDECASKHKPPTIPLQVITKNEAMRERLEWGREQLAAQKKKEETGLILPDGYKDTKS